MMILYWAYVVIGIVCAIAWIDFERRTYYAIFGPTKVGQVVGVILIMLFVITLWPLYYRLRAASRERESDYSSNRSSRKSSQARS